MCLLNLQKEDKIRLLRQRLVDKDVGKASDAQTIAQSSPTPGLPQGKESLNVIQPEHTTTSDFDSAIGGAISICTRSSRASQSDIEFSESYL